MAIRVRPVAAPGSLLKQGRGSVAEMLKRENTRATAKNTTAGAEKKIQPKAPTLPKLKCLEK